MINELNGVLVPDEELVRIREFKTMLEEVQERRDAERSKFEEIIKRMLASHSTDGIELEASVSELRESSTRASAEWRSFEEHASIMKGMENEKFDLAKKINDQEATLSMLESEIEELRRESEVMENWDIEEEVGMDRNVYASVKSHPQTALLCNYFAAWDLFHTMITMKLLRPSHHSLCVQLSAMSQHHLILIMKRCKILYKLGMIWLRDYGLLQTR